MKAGIRSQFAIAVHRLGYATDHDGIPLCFKYFNPVLRIIYHFGRYLSVVFCKIIIQEETKLGKNIMLSPKGNIILGAESIGNDCMIHHNVTFGMNLDNRKGSSGKPRLGNRVWIGPNTLIHGDVTIGDGVTILGGSVLNKDITDRCVVKGNPAKIIKKEVDNTSLFQLPGDHISIAEFFNKGVSDV
jgi:serine acetyltransferase